MTNKKTDRETDHATCDTRSNTTQLRNARHFGLKSQNHLNRFDNVVSGVQLHNAGCFQTQWVVHAYRSRDYCVPNDPITMLLIHVGQLR